MPISVPPYMPMRQQQRPNIDIQGAISGLGDALQEGRELRDKRRTDAATKAAFAEPVYNPDGSMNYAAIAGKIATSGGDIDTALTLTRLAEVQAQNAWQRNRPDWQVVGGDLYDLNDLGGQGAGPQPSGAGPQSSGTGPQPAPPGDPYSDPYGGGEPPIEELPLEEPQVATGPQPVIRGPKKPPQRRMGLDLEGNVVEEEADEEGNWRVVSGPKKTSPKSRVLSSTAVNDLMEAGSNAADINRLHTTWDDSYGGWGVGGEIANVAGTRVPGSRHANQARWWQDYQTRKNDLRHSKFGASLTPGEKAEFAKADINPNMDPPIIKTNLDRQQKILTGAAKRLAKVWIKQGYDADAIAEAVGYSREDLGVPASAEEGEATPGSAENAAGAENEPIEIDGQWYIEGPDGLPVPVEAP